MIDITKQVELFKKLPYEKKKEKIIEMLKKIKKNNENFNVFLENINKSKNIPELLFIYIYQSIFEAITIVKKKKNEENQKKIKEIKQKIILARKKEEEERQKENNFESILKNI